MELNSTFQNHPITAYSSSHEGMGHPRPNKADCPWCNPQREWERMNYVEPLILPKEGLVRGRAEVMPAQLSLFALEKVQTQFKPSKRLSPKERVAEQMPGNDLKELTPYIAKPIKNCQEIFWFDTPKGMEVCVVAQYGELLVGLIPWQQVRRKIIRKKAKKKTRK